MRYCIYAESENYYYIIHKINSYCLGTKITISKRKYIYWKQGKINDTDYNNIEQKAISKKEPTKKTVIQDEITPQQKEIMARLSKIVQDKQYILEGSISIDNYSKALVNRTVRDKNLLKQYNLVRVRANGEIKEKFNIESKGYPFIIKTT